MEKAHSRIKWENYPSIATPLNETNLNKMDIALDEVDNRVLGLDTAKLDKAVANSMVKDITFNEKTGIFTITSLDGTTKTFDTKLEKVATNFSYDYEKQKLKLTLLDGTEQEIDMSTLISQYEFADTSTIGFTVGNEGKITAIVKDGSVTEDKLQPNFLADIKVEVAKGKGYSESSYENATTSREASTQAKQYRDEAKQYRDEVQAVVEVDIATTEIAGLVKPDGTTITVDADGTIHSLGGQGTVDYTELKNKPSINGVELSGDKTFEELGFEGTKDYEVLENKPCIEGVELSGDKTLDELGIASKEVLDKTVFKVDTIIEKADLGIKETAIGEEIHLTDSADGKAVEYALYGKATQDGTPTPENPIDIVVAGSSGSVEVKSCGKNYLDISKTSTNPSVTSIEKTDNSIRIYNSESIDYSLADIAIDNSKMKIGKTYTISADVSIKYGTGRIIVRKTKDYSTIAETSIITASGKYQCSFTFQEECYVSLFSTLSTPEIGDITYSNLQLEEGIVATPYEPYKETLSTIPTPNGLAGIKVDSGGNYTDTNGQQWICDEVVKYADGSGKKIQRIGKQEYSGEFSNANVAPRWNDDYKYCWSIPRSNIPSDYHNPDKGTGKDAFMSNIGNDAWIGGSYFNVETNMTLEEFNNFMSDKKIIVLYKLAEPITTPLTAQQLADIETFYPVTNITNDFDCEMKVTYVGECIITTNTEIPIVAQDGELESGDNITTLFGKIKRKLETSGTGGTGSVYVVDNLSSTSKTSCLSANQGRILDAKITQTNESLANKESTLSERINEVDEKVVEVSNRVANGIKIGTISGNTNENGIFLSGIKDKNVIAFFSDATKGDTAVYCNGLIKNESYGYMCRVVNVSGQPYANQTVNFSYCYF